jgi:cell wall-associated NlpC family hydrolase
MKLTTKIFLTTLLILTTQSVTVPDIACADEPLSSACQNALTADFAFRDSLPESEVPFSEWYMQRYATNWGPAATTYPEVSVPAGCASDIWMRARVVQTALKYIGLPYRHHHIPAWDPPASLRENEGPGPGLDCSNFTSWVYNYGLGMRFVSDVDDQAAGPSAPGRILESGEQLEPGDILFIWDSPRTRVSHAVIYLDPEHIIDSVGAGVAIRSFSSWYRSRFSHARRVIESLPPVTPAALPTPSAMPPLCPAGLAKTTPGTCGCHNPDIDENQNGIFDCIDTLRTTRPRKPVLAARRRALHVAMQEFRGSSPHRYEIRLSLISPRKPTRRITTRSHRLKLSALGQHVRVSLRYRLLWSETRSHSRWSQLSRLKIQ